MPIIAEPVYQPTTVSVSYEPRSGRKDGNGSVAYGVLRRHWFQLILLLFGIVTLACGVAMLANGIANWPENIPVEDGYKQPTADDGTVCVQMPIGIIAGSISAIIIGLFAIGIYFKVADWRRICSCQCPLFDKKQSLARQFQCQNGGGCGQGIMALNPSTDPLVSHTQYAPVSELPHRVDEEERRNLMPDNKDCLSSAEESDRMLEPDPRIVLRPVGRVDDA